MKRVVFANQLARAAAVASMVSLTLASEGHAQSRSGGGAEPAQIQLSGKNPQGGSVSATETTAAGPGPGVSTLTPVLQAQGPFTGSTSRGPAPVPATLTLGEAIRRGLEYNLGTVNVSAFVKQARGQRTIARSALLPNLVADLTAARQETNLQAMGFHLDLPIPGFTFPTVVGPYNQVDLRARLSQSVIDMTAWNNYRAAKEVVQANEQSARDVRDLVVLAVGGAYFQTIAARGRVDSARAQLETANALFRQASERRAAGVSAQVDVDRSQVQALLQQQRVTSLQNDFAKQKINLARMIGLPPTDGYDLAASVPFTRAPDVTLDQALQASKEHRADVKALESQLKAGERALAAARSGRLPSLAVSADYGAIGPNVSDARRTFAVVGTVRVPLWQGGRAEGQIAQAEAAVAQRRAELDDLTSQVEADVRKAYLDLQAATSQVDLAKKNVEVSQETLTLTRQRFDVGVGDTIEVVQAQESVAAAELDSVNSVFAHHVATLSLARAMGQAEERVAEFVNVP